MFHKMHYDNSLEIILVLKPEILIYDFKYHSFLAANKVAAADAPSAQLQLRQITLLHP